MNYIFSCIYVRNIVNIFISYYYKYSVRNLNYIKYVNLFFYEFLLIFDCKTL